MVSLWPVEHASHAIEAWVESRVNRASQFKKSQTAVSTTELYFTLYMVSHIVDCSRRQRKGNLKKQWMNRKVCPTTTTS